MMNVYENGSLSEKLASNPYPSLAFTSLFYL